MGEGSSTDEKQVLEAFRAYVAAFETLNSEAIAPYYHEPCLLIAPPGVFVMATHSDVIRNFGDYMRDLRGRGFRSSTYTQLQAKLLGAGTAILSGMCVRKGAQGEELERFGQTCTLRLTKGKWRIAVNAIHEPSGALQLG